MSINEGNWNSKSYWLQSISPKPILSIDELRIHVSQLTMNLGSLKPSSEIHVLVGHDCYQCQIFLDMSRFKRLMRLKFVMISITRCPHW